MLRASVKRFSRACTTLFALSADRSNLQTDFCGKCPLFIERVTYIYIHGPCERPLIGTSGYEAAAIIPRVSRKIFARFSKRQEASHSCTHPQDYYVTLELTTSAYLSWYNNNVTTLGASISSYISEICFPIASCRETSTNYQVGTAPPKSDCWTDSTVIRPLGGSGACPRKNGFQAL